MEVNRRAPTVARDEVFVEASSERVWALQTDVSSWPGWRSDVSRAVHTWTFGTREGGVLVQTEESFQGWLVRPLRRTMRKIPEGSLRTWLADLKREAEREDNRA